MSAKVMKKVEHMLLKECKVGRGLVDPCNSIMGKGGEVGDKVVREYLGDGMGCGRMDHGLLHMSDVRVATTIVSHFGEDQSILTTFAYTHHTHALLNQIGALADLPPGF